LKRRHDVFASLLGDPTRTGQRFVEPGRSGVKRAARYREEPREEPARCTPATLPTQLQRAQIIFRDLFD